MDSRTGEILTEEQANIGVFYWQLNNPLYFRVKDHLDRPCNNNCDRITMDIRLNYNIHSALCIHKCWLFFHICTTLRPHTENFLHVFRCNVMNYLNSFSVISIDSVIRAVKHFLGRFERHIIYVENSAQVQFYLY